MSAFRTNSSGSLLRKNSHAMSCCAWPRGEVAACPPLGFRRAARSVCSRSSCFRRWSSSATPLPPIKSAREAGASNACSGHRRTPRRAASSVLGAAPPPVPACARGGFQPSLSAPLPARATSPVARSSRFVAVDLARCALRLHQRPSAESISARLSASSRLEAQTRTESCSLDRRVRGLVVVDLRESRSALPATPSSRRPSARARGACRTPPCRARPRSPAGGWSKRGRASSTSASTVSRSRSPNVSRSRQIVQRAPRRSDIGIAFSSISRCLLRLLRVEGDGVEGERPRDLRQERLRGHSPLRRRARPSGSSSCCRRRRSARS
jgi:hypothetical protein